MPFSIFFLHGGPWGQGGGPGPGGGWDGPPFGLFPFFPFFGLFPILFWGGLLFFLFTRLNRGRWQHGGGWHGRGGKHSSPMRSGPAPTAPSDPANPHGQTWPNLDPAGSVQMPPSTPKGAELEKRGDVEYI